MGSKRIVVISALAAALSAGIVTQFTSGGKDGQPVQRSSASITAINNTTLDQEAVQNIDGLIVPPRPEMIGGGRFTVGDDTEHAAINKAVLNVRNLRTWQLCAAELAAEARVNLAIAKDDVRFKLDRPHKPLTAAQLMSLTSDETHTAAVLRQAAELARQAGIACVPKDRSQLAGGRYVTMTAKDGKGNKVRFRDTDFAVMRFLLPVEYAVLAKDCPAKEMKDAREAKLQPIESDWSERQKAHAISLSLAGARMLRAAGVACQQ